MNINNIGMVDSWREDPFLPSRTGQVWVSPGQTTDYSGTFQQGPTAIAQCAATLYVYANCYWAGGMVGHGAGTYAYAAPSVPYGSSCAYEYRTCSNGTLYGSYGYPSCSVTPGANCTFNGSPVAHTASVTAYQSSIVPFGSSCVSQQRTCSNGTLSGGCR